MLKKLPKSARNAKTNCKKIRHTFKCTSIRPKFKSSLLEVHNLF